MINSKNFIEIQEILKKDEKIIQNSNCILDISGSGQFIPQMFFLNPNAIYYSLEKNEGVQFHRNSFPFPVCMSITRKEFKKMKNENLNKKRFDYVIGNPPYQRDCENGATAIYNEFVDKGRELSASGSVIIPARWAFRAGRNKSWSKKIRKDENLELTAYYPDATEIFSDVVIAGGVCVLHWGDGVHTPGGIGGKYDCLIPSQTMYGILEKVCPTYPNMPNKFMDRVGTRNCFLVIDDKTGKVICHSGESLKFHSHFKYSLTENDNPEDFVRVACLKGKAGVRIWVFVPKSWLNCPIDYKHYKVFIPSSRGNSTPDFIEKGDVILSKPFAEIGKPGDLCTETFIPVLADSYEESVNIQKYLQTKFLRGMVSVLKNTQSAAKEVYDFVPDQDFTSSSDIDWSLSISEIDKQLYKKYSLTKEEIEFVEKRVKKL